MPLAFAASENEPVECNDEAWPHASRVCPHETRGSDRNRRCLGLRIRFDAHKSSRQVGWLIVIEVCQRVLLGYQLRRLNSLRIELLSQQVSANGTTECPELACQYQRIPIGYSLTQVRLPASSVTICAIFIRKPDDHLAVGMHPRHDLKPRGGQARPKRS